MRPWLPLCLALCSAPAWAGAKPKPRPAAAAVRANPDVPPAGSCGEVVDPATGRGRAVGPLPGGLTDAQATVWPDGRVLITGGTLASAGSHWYDPARRVFTPGPPLTRPRQGHRALLLKDGSLLVVGGTDARTAPERLEPGAPAFQAMTGDATFGLSAEAVALDDGRVLLVDGASGQCTTWDARKGFRRQATLDRPRACFELTRLKDGKVLITGGWPGETRRKGRAPAAAADLPVACFNPRWGTLSTWSALPRPRARHQATLLEDGRVCLWAGVGTDGARPCEAVELLDPANGTVTLAGTLPLGGQGLPGWAGGFFLDEQQASLREAREPLALLAPPGPPRLRLANAYLAPTLVPLADGQVLVLGSPAWGAPMDHWDAHTRLCDAAGALRAGTPALGLAPDGKVLALGPVVDQVEPRTGALTALGWREELAPLLAKVKPYQPASSGPPPFAPGQARRDCLVVPLDRTRALVAGGVPEDSDEPSAQVDLWDQKRGTLTPMGPMKTRRAFPKDEPGCGGLKLPDGSVLIWGPGKL